MTGPPVPMVLAQRKLKMSNYVDQTDDSEFLPAGRKVVERWYANFVAFAQGPSSDAEAEIVGLGIVRTWVYSIVVRAGAPTSCP